VVNLAKSRLRLRRETPVEDWSGGRAIREFVWMDAEPTPEARQEARELHDRIWSALGALPQEQQETVQLHYVDGLRVWEIAALVGAPTGTVKARLHRARGRLLRTLAAELGVPLDTGGRRQEEKMIPVTVDDLIYRVPKEGDVRYLEVPEWRTPNVGHLRVVLLKEREGQGALPIWVGAVEGDAIALALAGPRWRSSTSERGSRRVARRRTRRWSGAAFGRCRTREPRRAEPSHPSMGYDVLLAKCGDLQLGLLVRRP
jgi:hypothetical protein